MYNSYKHILPTSNKNLQFCYAYKMNKSNKFQRILIIQVYIFN